MKNLIIFLLVIIFSAKIFGQEITSYYDTKYGYGKVDSNTIVIFSENDQEVFFDKKDRLKKVISEKEYLSYLKFKDKDVLKLSNEGMIEMWKDKKPKKISEKEAKEYFWFTFPQNVKIKTYTKYAEIKAGTIETRIIESEKISTDQLTDVLLCLVLTSSFILVLKFLVLYKSNWNTIKIFNSTLLFLLLILVIARLYLLKFFRYPLDFNSDPGEIISFIFVIYILLVFFLASLHIFYRRNNLPERSEKVNEMTSSCINYIFLFVVATSIPYSLGLQTFVPVFYGFILLVLFGSINKILKKRAEKIGI